MLIVHSLSVVININSRQTLDTRRSRNKVSCKNAKAELLPIFSMFVGVCTVSGWGRVEFGGSMTRHLHHVDLPIVEDEECKKSYTAHGWDLIRDTVICAGYTQGGKDACQV